MLQRVVLLLAVFSAAVLAKKDDENDCEGACSALPPVERAAPRTGRASPAQHAGSQPCSSAQALPPSVSARVFVRESRPRWRGYPSGGPATRQRPDWIARTAAVCRSVIGAIDAVLTVEDRKSETKIEKAMKKYCDTAKAQDKKMVRARL